MKALVAPVHSGCESDQGVAKSGYSQKYQYSISQTLASSTALRRRADKDSESILSDRLEDQLGSPEANPAPRHLSYPPSRIDSRENSRA